MMDRWKRSISIKGLHDRYQSGELDVFGLCNAVAKLVDGVKRHYSEGSEEWYELDDIAGCFEWSDRAVFDEERVTIDDYNDWLEQLYQWGDVDRRLWVSSIA